MNCKDFLVKRIKSQCKIILKKYNPEQLSLMKIQHNYSNFLGYKNWSELLKANAVELTERLNALDYINFLKFNLFIKEKTNDNR